MRAPFSASVPAQADQGLLADPMNVSNVAVVGLRLRGAITSEPWETITLAACAEVVG